MIACLVQTLLCKHCFHFILHTGIADSMGRFHTISVSAVMAELADALDLGSSGTP